MKLYKKYTKYPRTPHLPFSPGCTKDDTKLKNVDHFRNKEVIVSLKLDGEGTSMYSDHIHARSIDSKDHESRHWVKSLHGMIKGKIFNDTRLCGENMYAKHSIHYKNLDSYFYLYSTWDRHNEFCFPWIHTEYTAGSMLVRLVPVLYEGVFDEELIAELAQKKEFNGDEVEGLVVRLKQGFFIKDFDKSVAKYVRPNHVKTDAHWMQGNLVKNKLRAF